MRGTVAKRLRRNLAYYEAKFGSLESNRVNASGKLKKLYNEVKRKGGTRGY